MMRMRWLEVTAEHYGGAIVDSLRASSWKDKTASDANSNDDDNRLLQICSFPACLLEALRALETD